MKPAEYRAGPRLLIHCFKWPPRMDTGFKKQKGEQMNHITLKGVASALCIPLSALASFGQTPMSPVPKAPHLESFQRDATPVDPSNPMMVGISLRGYDKAAADAFIGTLHDPTSPNFQHW